MDTPSNRPPRTAQDSEDGKESSASTNTRNANKGNPDGTNTRNSHTGNPTLANPYQKQLSASLLNCWSLGNKALKLHEYTVQENIDLFLFTETWLTGKEETVIAELTPPGYEFKHRPRPGGKKGGGVGLMFRNTLKWSKASSHSFKSFEHLDQMLTCGSSLLHIIVVYRPPSSSFTDFIQEFSSLMESACVSKGRLLIVGDFNIHVDNSSDAKANQFKEVLDSFNMTQHVNEKTHKGKHTLDLIITREDDSVSDITTDENDLSDHLNECSQNIHPPTRFINIKPEEDCEREHASWSELERGYSSLQ